MITPTCKFNSRKIFLFNSSAKLYGSLGYRIIFVPLEFDLSIPALGANMPLVVDMTNPATPPKILSDSLKTISINFSLELNFFAISFALLQTFELFISKIRP